MLTSFNGNGQAVYTETSGSFEGILVNITNSAALTQAQLESCQLVVNLQRNGQSTPIVSGNLYAAALGADPTQLEGAVIQTTLGFNYGLKVDFGAVINLKGNDVLQIQVSGNGLPTTAVTTVSTEYGVGVETFTPSVIIFPVDKTRSNFSIPAFDNVTAITFIQSAAPGAAVKQLFTGINITSDKWQGQYNAALCNALIANQWDTAPTRLSFFAYVGEPLDKCSINYNIDTTSTDGNGYVVIYTGGQTDTQKARAKALIQKIASKEAQTWS